MKVTNIAFELLAIVFVIVRKKKMDTNADNLELNQDELIIQQQRQIEKEVSK